MIDYLGMIDIDNRALMINNKDFVLNYDEHQKIEELKNEISLGNLFRGKLRISRTNSEEGTVMTNFGFEIKILGLESINRAVNGDLVGVELQQEESWLVIKTQENEDIDDEYDEKDDFQKTSEQFNQKSQEKYRKLVLKIKELNLIPTGKIKGVIKTNWRNLCGEIDQFVDKDIGLVAVKPVDIRYPNILIRLNHPEKLLKKRIVVSIDIWNQNDKYPIGHFVDVLGDSDDIVTESKVILFEHNVETRAFSQQVLACLPAEGANYVIKPEELAKRMDLRHINVCSVDPPGCKDIDDAQHAQVLPNGNYEVGVHIADVTHYVRPDAPIDKEAAHRCTTVYLVDRRTDMLPSLLTENLCSLRCLVDRLAFSCIWEINPKNGRIINVKFGKSVIHSKASLTYQQAQDRIDEKSDKTDLTNSLRILNKIAKMLKQERLKKGALTQASTQVKFTMDQETHNPTDVAFYSQLETNSMVEEFMLLANVSVAGKIIEHYPSVSVLRRHTSPKPNMIKEFSGLMSQLGYKLDYSSSMALAESLDNIDQPNNPFFNKLIRILTTRCMNEATYFCTADYDYPEYQHYGLAASLYTHFTSPIRRYADVLVHRLLAASLDIDSLPTSISSKQKLSQTCERMNMRHRNARFASRASSDYFSYLFFKVNFFGDNKNRKKNVLKKESSAVFRLMV